MDRASTEKKTFELVEAVGELLALGGLLEDTFSLFRQRQKFRDPTALLSFRKRTANLSEILREKKQHRHLRGESFGGRDADLRASVSVQNAISLTRNGRADYVRDRNGARAFFLRFALRGSSVGGLT